MSLSVGDPIYLDHNATTPVDPRVVEAMAPYLEQLFGNPASVEHVHGHRAQLAVIKAREQIAASIGARENEIILTASCTEADNIAILGSARAQPDKRHIVTSAIEHPAVLEPCRHLKKEGYELTVLSVDEQGRVASSDVEAAIRHDTLLVSIMGANNEVGTIQPIAEIGETCERRGVLFHTDLAQVMAHRKVNVVSEHIHLASLSGHKVYAPKGVGALYVRSRSPRARIRPIMFGGGQEKGIRPGTIAVPLAVGLGEALEIAGRQAAEDNERLLAMTRSFVKAIQQDLPNVHFNGDPENRIANNVSLSIPGVEPLALIHKLNTVASFSASSACATEKVQTSPVLLAMFGDIPRAQLAFRVSPGRFTKESDLLNFAQILIDAARDLRRYAA